MLVFCLVRCKFLSAYIARTRYLVDRVAEYRTYQVVSLQYGERRTVCPFYICLPLRQTVVSQWNVLPTRYFLASRSNRPWPMTSRETTSKHVLCACPWFLVAHGDDTAVLPCPHSSFPPGATRRSSLLPAP